ncbi:MAG: hypothetical protein C0598_06790 [Marinilabiliales bacterium]|nr:MAG: hypothetical protein C0598_06790 [Marinilabiliales bacterium]
MLVKEEVCKNLSDEEIIKKSLLEIDYFACLYNRYDKKLLRYIKRLSMTSEEEANDILQDSFIKIWRNINNYDSNLKFSSWVYRIVHNETVTHYRKNVSFGKNNTVKIDNSDNLDISEDDDAGNNEEHYILTHKVLQKMSLKYREVLVLSFLEKMSYTEISDVLKIPEGSVASRINRAKKMFKSIVEKENISINE